MSEHESRGWQTVLHNLQNAHTADVAEAYARGERCVSVIYGNIETAEEQADLDSLTKDLHDLAETLGADNCQWLRTGGRDDRCTWWFGSSDDVSAEIITARAVEVARGYERSWWRISQDPE